MSCCRSLRSVRARRIPIGERLEQARTRIRRLSPDAAASAQADGAIIVDIRDSADRLTEGVIPHSRWVTRNTLEWRADPVAEIPDPELSDFSAELIIVCNDGYASSLAADSLSELGHRGVADLLGGFRAWKHAGLPIEVLSGDEGR